MTRSVLSPVLHLPLWFGVDVSTEKIAIVGINTDNEFVATEVFSTVRGPKGGKKKDMYSLVDSFVKALTDVAGMDAKVGIEGLPFVKSRTGIVSFGKVLGAMQYGLHLSGVQSEIVDGYEWKMGLGLKGNADKAVVAGWVEENCPRLEVLTEIGSQDIMDAYAIARYMKDKYREHDH